MYNVFRVYFFLATMNKSTAELIAIADKDLEQENAADTADSMVTTFGVVQGLGVFFAPINGFIIDAGLCTKMN